MPTAGAPGELLDVALAMSQCKGSFDCGFASLSRSKILAQDDRT
jgi:hypothetical protein